MEALEELKPKIFKFQDRNLSYFDAGKKLGDSILITHANGYSAGCYSYLIEELSKTHRVLALDFAGQGNSEGSMDFESWLYFRDQIFSLLEKENIKKIIGIGHSLGGASLLLAASVRPELFSKIIAFDPVVLSYSRILYGKIFGVKLAEIATSRRRNFKDIQIVRRAFRKFPAFSKWDERVFEDYLKYCFRKTGKEGVELCCDPLLEAKIFDSKYFRLLPFYSKVKSEVHLLIPEKYEVCPPGTAKKIVKGNPRSTITNIPGATHFFPFEKPDWTLEKVRSLL